MTDPLVAPKPGQSLGGLIMEGAAALGERTVHGLLAEAGSTIVGLVHHALAPEQLSVIAEAFGLAPEEFALRHHGLIADAATVRSFHGVPVDGRLIEKRTRRFAPASLVEEPWHRAAWQLRPLPFCERSWTFVTDACRSCGVVQRWSRAWGPDLCDSCAVPLAEGSTGAVPATLRPSLRLAAGLLHHHCARRAESLDALPHGLRRLGAGGCFEVLCAVAGVLDPSVRSRHFPQFPIEDGDAGRLAATMAAAWDVIVGWPDAVLAECDARLARRIGRHGDGNRGATAALLRLDERATTSSTLRSAVGDLRAVVAERRSGHIDTREFARLSGVAASNVAKARRSGRLPSVLGMTEAGEVVPLLPRSEAAATRRLIAEGLTAERAAARIGCTYRAVEELIEIGLLVRSAPAADHCRGDRLKIEAAGLLHLLPPTAVATTEDGDGFAHPLSRALDAVGGRLKPWSAVFRALRSGALPFALASGSRSLVERVLIRREDVDLVRRLPSVFEDDDARFDQWMSKKDAHAVLNVEGRYAGDLLAEWASSTGSDRTVPVAAVLRLAERIVSSREIAARSGRRAHGVCRMRRHLDAREPTAGFFNRSAMLEALEDAERGIDSGRTNGNGAVGEGRVGRRVLRREPGSTGRRRAAKKKQVR